MNQPAQPKPFPTQQTCGMATGSMVCGIASLVLSFLASIPAIILGHLALGRIKRSAGGFGGSGRAVTGLVLGYLTTAGGLVFAVATLKILEGDQAYLIESCRRMGINLEEFSEEYEFFPSQETAKEVIDRCGGNTPISRENHLSQLVAAGWIPRKHLDDFLTVRGRGTGDWLYCGASASPDDFDAALLISPEVGGKKVVLMVDGSTKLVSDTEVAGLLAALKSPPQRIPAIRR